MKIRVFISSTFRDLEREREFIEIICRNLGFEPRYYPEQSAAGSFNRDYIKNLQDSHILIYLATQTSSAVEDELEVAEHMGMPIIELARFEASGNAVGIGPAAKTRRKSSPRFQRKFSCLSDIQSALEQSLSEILYTRFQSAKRLEEFGAGAYALADKAVQAATFRVGIMQETPTLMLGPDQLHFLQEDPYYESLKSLIRGNLENSKTVELIYVYNYNRTLQELQSNSDHYPRRVEALEWLEGCKSGISMNDNISIVGVDGTLTAAIVHDSSLEITTGIGGRRYFLWLDEVGGAANDFWRVFRNLIRNGRSLDEYIEKANGILEV